MTTTQPDVKPNDRLNIRQAAQKMDVHQNTIRNWVMQGVFKASELSDTKYGRHMIIILGKGLLRVWSASNIK